MPVPSVERNILKHFRCPNCENKLKKQIWCRHKVFKWLCLCLVWEKNTQNVVLAQLWKSILITTTLEITFSTNINFFQGMSVTGTLRLID